MYKNGPTLWNFTIKIIFLLDSILIIMIGSQNFTLTSSSDPMFSFSLLSIRQQWMFLWRLKNLVWYVHFIMIWISNIQTVKHGKRKFYFQPRPDARTWKEQFPVIHVSYLQSEGKYEKKYMASILSRLKALKCLPILSKHNS